MTPCGHWCNKKLLVIFLLYDSWCFGHCSYIFIYHKPVLVCLCCYLFIFFMILAAQEKSLLYGVRIDVIFGTWCKYMVKFIFKNLTCISFQVKHNGINVNCIMSNWWNWQYDHLQWAIHVSLGVIQPCGPVVVHILRQIGQVFQWPGQQWRLFYIKYNNDIICLVVSQNRASVIYDWQQKCEILLIATIMKSNPV